MHRQCITAYEIDAHLKNLQFIESLWIFQIIPPSAKTISYLDTEDQREGERQHDQQCGEPTEDESAGPGARGVS